jgi:hypothetical protein
MLLTCWIVQTLEKKDPRFEEKTLNSSQEPETKEIEWDPKLESSQEVGHKN